MTHVEHDSTYRPPHPTKMRALTSRHAAHTQTMLIAAICASLAIICTAAAMMTVLF